MFEPFAPVLQLVWGAVRDSIALDDGEPARIRMSGPRTVLPCPFDVTGLATAAVASAHLAASRVLAARRASAGFASVSVDSRGACAAFATERLFTPIGWERPAAWDEIAGNYRCADGWIKLHTNYAYHRRAVEEVLDAHDRTAVAARVADWGAEALETAVVGAGGAAAALHSDSTWLASSAGAATRDAPVASTRWVDSSERPGPAGAVSLPFDGLKVLDLTRVIAGPVCTGFLASMGADVLRIDPPGFAEVAPLVPVTTAGKRTAALDHATGWLLASAIGRVLQRQILDGRTATIHASLIGTARLLQSLPNAEGAVATEQFPPLVETETAWGPAETVGPAGHIAGVSPVSRHRAGPLGRDAPQFL
ncbi:CoA transferase [Galactobacter sp.]|uniref:CoA transferase n=1 Tax=Galactobacter sp. TaxID=2676125 RepID=UPI0025C3676E|nr:CoA transferase [Galactobacter sp.]